MGYPYSRISIPEDSLGKLRKALQATKHSYASGRTHNFYHYPARFSPDIAQAVIEVFSSPDEYVLDPFMGGGTSIIEGVTLGRRMIGADLNALAHFITDVRTRPLTPRDEFAIRVWAAECALFNKRIDYPMTEFNQVKNIPNAFRLFIGFCMYLTSFLNSQRQRAFARSVLLRLGQWALDCREFKTLRRNFLSAKLLELTNSMLMGLKEFVNDCQLVGVTKKEITDRRLLICRNAIGIHDDPKLNNVGSNIKLVFTSPPYPGVHVIYHRWQYRGRKETAAPYLIANVSDGYCGSYYTGGSRTASGQLRYFEMIASSFASIRQLLSNNAIVVQLVGFSNISTQLPQYLNAMEKAGFKECMQNNIDFERLGRRVPNRKWYAKLKGTVDASREFLLFHRPL